MSSDLALMLTNELVWTAIMIAGPVLIVSMVVGLAISIFQVVTQIQEMSLTFVPKIFAVGLTVIICGAWMLDMLIKFSVSIISNIPAYF